MAALGQKRVHAAFRHELPDQRLRVQQFPIRTRPTLHATIIPTAGPRARQTRRPADGLFSGLLDWIG